MLDESAGQGVAPFPAAGDSVVILMWEQVGCAGLLGTVP
jgi:hypothetical protein